MDTVVDRSTRVRGLLDALPGAELRGSLATGTADDLSDIDLTWACGPSADRRLVRLPVALGSMGTVESLRLDPDTAEDPGRRLVFVRFAGWPLHERVDLEMTGSFRLPSAPWAPPWSAAESALMNVLGAVKALRRGRGDVDGLLASGFTRIDATDPGGASPVRLHALIDAAVRASPEHGALAARIHREVDRPW